MAWIRPPRTLLLLLLAVASVSEAVVRRDEVWSPPGVSCTMCASCDNPCQPAPVASSPPPPSPPPPPATSSDCPPPPSPPAPTNYYSPPPPSGGGGSSYNPPSGGSYPAPTPPNPILPYFPFYYYSPPPPSKFVSGSHSSLNNPRVFPVVAFLLLNLCFIL